MQYDALINSTLTLFFILTVGFIARKIGLIDDNVSKIMSKIMMCLGQPMMILGALTGVEYSPVHLKEGLTTFLLGTAGLLFLSALSHLICSKMKNQSERSITEFAVVFGNSAFFGFPVLESLFGPRALFLGAFYVVGFNLLIWTLGITILSRSSPSAKPTWKKALFNYGTIPCLIGLLIYILQVPIPIFIGECFSYIGNICTPFSMLITGALLATRTPKQIITSKNTYLVCLLKLIVFPLIIGLVVKLCGFSDEFVIFFTAMSAMPTASSTVAFGEIYDVAPGYASQVVGVTSLVVVLTLPITMYLSQFILMI